MDDRKNQNREPENGSGGGPKNRQTILIILICLLVSLMVMGLLNNALGGITSEDLDYSKFLDMVNNDEVQEVVLKSGTLTVTPKDQKSEGITYQVTMMGDEQELVDLLQEKGITYHKDPPDSTGTDRTRQKNRSRRLWISCITLENTRQSVQNFRKERFL